MMSLEDLLRAARDGEPGAWERLTPVLVAKLEAYFGRWTDPAEAEEWAQLTLVALGFQLPGFEPRASFVGWVLGMARNIAHRSIRTRTRRRALHEAAEVVLATSEPGLSSQLDQAELGQIMLEEIAKLPEHLRAIIELDLNEGDREAFARDQGISMTTVRTRRYRAHLLLEEQIAARLVAPGRGRGPSPQPSSSSSSAP